MPRKTVIRRIGNSLGVTIPRTMLESYKLSEGERAHLVETDRGVLLTPYDPEFETAMSVYQESAKTYRDAMRELAKR